ncbi:uncharacterized protein E6C27_scaffold335G00260 [Cucumis melo var. makuwa]|uniref:HTH three-helical bundle domain-containing protein n=2 Tax=Cucumis melo TaxID=3656 RepID=A0A5A7TJT5_CUCMM|nr:uncharacterized protein LOC103499533 [Cucumis melo]KAA0043532.1 uncharacterized protein E6C27_scaffold335G00260 [Cucumis melo var. makuwa]
MAEFPSPLERTVASALLLLSISPSPPSTPISEDEWLFEKNIEGKCSREISAFCDYSNTSSSILTTSDASSHTPPLERLLFLTYPCRHQLMLNVVRKSRSKLVRISENRNLSSTDEVTLSSGSASSETTSCLSSSSSVVTSAPIHRLVTRAEKKLEMIRHAWRKKQIASAHMRRRAEAILSYLSDGCSSEVKIRQVIGDSPDTSKALRILLKLEEIKRSGTGGRQDPYMYKIA